MTQTKTAFTSKALDFIYFYGTVLVYAVLGGVALNVFLTVAGF